MVQQPGDLFTGEPQVAGTYFAKLAAAAPTSQLERRVEAGGDDDVDGGWQVIDQVIEAFVNRFVCNVMVVVQDQGKMRTGLKHVADDPGYQRAVRGRLRGRHGR